MKSFEIHKMIYSLVYRFYSFIRGNPHFFFPLIKLRGRKYKELAVGKHTELVIEGFPRSSNTFAVVAFRFFRTGKQKPIKIAHHLHAPAQIIRASRRGLPCVVLIRKPLDAIISFMVYRPYLTVRQALKSYSYFYNKIFPYRDAFVVGLFDEVISNFGIVIERINKRYGTNFSQFENSQENVQKCFERIDTLNLENYNGSAKYVARPTREKGIMKSAIMDEFNDKKLKTLIKEVEELYENYTKNLE